MRAVVQRVRQASVRIADAVRAEIGPGLLVLVAIAENDTTADGEWLAGKSSECESLPMRPAG